MSTPLLDLIISRLIGVKRCSQGTVTAQCPACASEGRDSKHEHLKVWPSGAFNCIAQSSPEHNRIIRAAIRGGLEGTVDYLLTDSEYIDPEPKLDIPKVYPEEMLSRLVADHSYWIGRGISPEVLSRIGGGVASADEKSKLSGRYVLPCRDPQGRIVGWAARLLSDASFGPRWKILGKKGHFIFPPVDVSTSSARAKGEVILVEGQGCALALMSAGLSNVITLFGVKLSSKVIGRIVALAPQRVIIATNNEASGIGARAAEEIREVLSRFVSPEHIEIRLPPVKDFGVMSERDPTYASILAWYSPAAAPVAETPSPDTP